MKIIAALLSLLVIAIASPLLLIFGRPLAPTPPQDLGPDDPGVDVDGHPEGE